MTPSFDEYLKTHLDRYVQETARYCAQPSISARNEGTAECAVLVAELLREHGLTVETYATPGNPVVVGRMSGQSPRTLLFYNHYDVQPPEPLELWTTPPFEPTVRDGALYARGAKDDKGELVSRLAALDAVRAAHGGSLPCGVLFVVEGQEEIGSPHMRQFVLDHLDILKSDAAIWEEGGTDANGRPGTALGVRGILYVQLEVETLKMDAHSGGANRFPNAAWRLVRALNTLKDENEHILIPGFYDNIVPASALDHQLIDAIPPDELAQNEQELRDHFIVDDFVLHRTGKELELCVFEPTCNIAGITSGFQGEGLKTVIPAKASAKIDFRLLPKQDPQDILKKLRAHLDQQGFKDVTVTPLGGMMWPVKISPDHPFIKLYDRTAEEVYGKSTLNTPMIGGSSPVYAFAEPLGNIPVVFAGVGYDKNRTHSPDEHVRLVDLLNAARQFARMIEEFAGI
jgi:acetylornithine deacetylase/succinyl-diaminopimelate desuccinylase-like protein